MLQMQYKQNYYSHCVNWNSIYFTIRVVLFSILIIKIINNYKQNLCSINSIYHNVNQNSLNVQTENNKSYPSIEFNPKLP